eukprot:15485211-Alexandrium_andersonii.AAC.1
MAPRSLAGAAACARWPSLWPRWRVRPPRRPWSRGRRHRATRVHTCFGKSKTASSCFLEFWGVSCTFRRVRAVSWCFHAFSASGCQCPKPPESTRNRLELLQNCLEQKGRSVRQ